MKKISNIVHKINKQNIKKGIHYIQNNGFGGLSAAIQSHTKDAMQYQEWFMQHRVGKEQIELQKCRKFAYQPLISLLVPAYHTPAQMLTELLESVIQQTYDNWELCIAVGSKDDTQMEQILEQYQKKDKRIRVQILSVNGGISENTNAALAMADGEFCALLDHDDLIEPDALYEVVNVLQDGKTDIVYTDEDKVNEALTEYSDPNFKPDFSPDLLRSQNYITHLFVVRTGILRRIGGFRKEFDGAQDYDVILRCAEQTENIAHVPKILYHWRMIDGSTASDPKTKMYCYEAGRNAIAEHLERSGIKASVEHAKLLGRYHVIYELNENPLLTVVIAQTGPDAQEQIRQTILTHGGYRNCEFLYVNEAECILAYNKAAKMAKGDYFLFINGKIEPRTEDSVKEMLALCMQEQVGVVGTKIIDKKKRIRDAGIILGCKGSSGHAFRGLDVRAHSYMNRAEQIGNYSALSADVLMVSRKLFEQIGGFRDTDQETAQINFCKQIGRRGKRIVFHGFSEWLDYEADKRNISVNGNFSEEKEDPFYNKNLTLTGKPFTLDRI